MTVHHRKDQLASMLRLSVQGVLSRGLSDPRLDGAMLTVTEVDLAPDYSNAVIRVSVLPEKAQKRSIAALQHAAKHIRHEVSEKLNLRSTPQFHFELDVSTKKQADVLAALSKVREEREAKGEPAPAEVALPENLQGGKSASSSVGEGAGAEEPKEGL